MHNGESLLFPAAIRQLATQLADQHATQRDGLAEANLTERETDGLARTEQRLIPGQRPAKSPTGIPANR